MASLRGGHTVTLEISRAGRNQTLSATLAPLPLERIPGIETVYTHVTNPAGLRQRAIITRPAGVASRLPAILFAPWLSCDTVESPGTPAPGIDELLVRVAAQSGWVMLRVDKPGVGDSEGVCADTDLDTEIAGSRAGLAMLRTHPWVNAERIVLMGHSFSGAFLPLIAESTPVAGYIFINSWARTWIERLLEFERLRLETAGQTPAEVSSAVRRLSEFYALFLEQRKTPGEILQERPSLGAVWRGEAGHQYGRSARFHHQLQAIDPATAWQHVSVPTLVMWGDADISMHRQDHERIVAMVNRNKAGAASLVVINGADHALAVRDAGGQRLLSAAALQATIEFLRGLR